MANNRDQQEILLTLVTGPPTGKDQQEVLLVLGPSLTITTPLAADDAPQVCVIT